MTLLEQARFYKSHDIVAIPLHPRSKLPYFKWKYWSNKMPRDVELREWFNDESRNIGIICGGSRNLVVIDFDTIEGYTWWVKKCLASDSIWRKVAEDGYKVKSSRGFHVYVTTDRRVESRELKDRGIGIRSHDHYVLVPPSVHPGGTVYEGIGEFNLFAVEDLQTFMEVPPIERKAVPQIDDVWDIDLILKQEGSPVERIKKTFTMLSYVSRLTTMECKSPDHRWWYGRCVSPYHEDKNPSFRVDTVNNMCTCMTPSCMLFEEKGLDVIALHARLNGMSMKESINDLNIAIESQTIYR